MIRFPSCVAGGFFRIFGNFHRELWGNDPIFRACWVEKHLFPARYRKHGTDGHVFISKWDIWVFPKIVVPPNHPC